MTEENHLCDCCGVDCFDKDTKTTVFGLLIKNKDELRPERNMNMALCAQCFQGAFLFMAQMAKKKREGGINMDIVELSEKALKKVEPILEKYGLTEPQKEEIRTAIAEGILHSG